MMTMAEIFRKSPELAKMLNVKKLFFMSLRFSDSLFNNSINKASLLKYPKIRPKFRL